MIPRWAQADPPFGLANLYTLLHCPTDQSQLVHYGDSLCCPACAAQYRLWAPQMVEALPGRFPIWNLAIGQSARALVEYERIFARPFSWGDTAGAWGVLPGGSPGYASFVRAECARIVELLEPHSKAIAVDVSAGCGNFSLPIAERVGAMVHCDLHVPSLLAAYAERRPNVLFVRTPYLALPFANGSFDRAICTDTLIRGVDHDLKLLQEICRVLKPSAKAVVDFHGPRPWRNPDVITYDPTALKALLAAAGITSYTVHPFGWVPTRVVPRPNLFAPLDALFSRFLSCQRYIVVFSVTALSC